MRKRTTLNIEMDLVREAEDELGTSGTTETIHRALIEVITMRKRQRLAASDFPDLTGGALQEMRRGRTGEGADRLQPA